MFQSKAWSWALVPSSSGIVRSSGGGASDGDRGRGQTSSSCDQAQSTLCDYKRQFFACVSLLGGLQDQALPEQASVFELLADMPAG